MNVSSPGYLPVFEILRGDVVESLHYGAVAVVAASGELLAWYGDVEMVSYQRSTAKPFQVLPLIETGGQDLFGLTLREIAIMCGSHSGTDDHIAVVKSLQRKTGVLESDLLCGQHYPFHTESADALKALGQNPSSNHHNCSGKHTGMLALAKMLAQQDTPAGKVSYIEPSHPVQGLILESFASLHGLPVGEVKMGVDGCSAPNFAVPLRSTALALARLCDPETGVVVPARRATACRTIVQAMLDHPDMVAGPSRFDTGLMSTYPGRLISKSGAEGYQGIGLMPGVLGERAPGIGIALKISDGSYRKNTSFAVALEVLRQLGIASDTELERLGEFGPQLPVKNWRGILVGIARPVFHLNRV